MPHFNNTNVQLERPGAEAGITFRLAKSQQDLEDLTDIYFEDFLKGKFLKRGADKMSFVVSDR